MGKTYQAILEGDRLIWTGDRPAENQQRLHVRVSVDEPEASHEASDEASDRPPEGIIHRPTPEQVEEGLRAIERLRAMGGIKSIPDPSAWQREIRKDRPLPGREES